MLLDFLNYLKYPGSPKIKINGVGAQGHVPKSRNHRNEGLAGSQIRKSKSCKFKLKRNNTMELLSTPFPEIYHTNSPNIATK